MNITVPITTKRWAVLLLLMAGVAVFATGVEAQSRGRTQGRKEQSEKTENQGRSSSEQQASKNESQRSSSQRSNGSAQRSQGTATRGRSSSQRSAVRGGGSGSQASPGNARNSRSAQNSRNTQNSTQSRSSGNRATENRSGASSGGSGRSNAGSSRSSGANARGTDSRVSSGQRSTGGNASSSRNRSTNNTRGSASSRQNTQSRGGNAQGSRRNDRGSNARGRDDDRGNQGNARRDRIQPAPGYARGRTSNQYQGRRYVYAPPGRRGRQWVPPVYYHRPHVQINVVWPWQNRYRRKWAPHYKYRQVVYVQVGWGGHRRQARVDVRTNYHQQVRFADNRRAVVDIYLDEIEVYEEGYYVGSVRRIPEHLSHIEATIYRDGDVVFDRDVFLVGDSRSGFEMIATRHQSGFILDYYDRSRGVNVGYLNFRRKRVEPIRYSRLFDPYDFRGYAPISLLPEDRNLVADFGYESLSYGYYDDQYDPYYGGRYDDDYYDYDEYGNDYRYNRPAYDYDAEPYASGVNRLSVEAIAETRKPLTGHSSNQFTSKQGIAIKYERETELQRIK